MVGSLVAGLDFSVAPEPSFSGDLLA